MSAYVDLTHTGTAYLGIEYNGANAILILSYSAYFEFANFFKMLLRVTTFILVFCMCYL